VCQPVGVNRTDYGKKKKRPKKECVEKAGTGEKTELAVHSTTRNGTHSRVDLRAYAETERNKRSESWGHLFWGTDGIGKRKE